MGDTLVSQPGTMHSTSGLAVSSKVSAACLGHVRVVQFAAVAEANVLCASRGSCAGWLQVSVCLQHQRLFLQHPKSAQSCALL